MGYSAAQLEALRQTLNQAEVDVIVLGTPIDLAAMIEVNKPIRRSRYEFADLEEPGLEAAVEQFLDRLGQCGHGPRPFSH
jgi:predicted GTPase